MRIAYFSPLNPQKSGISDYSEYLLEALKPYAEIDLWVEGIVPTNSFIINNFKIYDYVKNPENLNLLNDYDEIIYNIGNNPYYHTLIYDTFLKYNGIVILHEYVLYYLITGYLLDYFHNGDLYIKELKYNHGDYGYKEGLNILKSEIPPLQYKFPELLPLNKRLIDTAKGIIVHSEHAKEIVLGINKEVSCVKINQIGPDPKSVQLSEDRKKELKKKYDINDEVILASFGYIAPTKRIHQVLHALSQMGEKKYKYLLVGEGDYVKDLIKKYKLQNKVILTGFTTIEEFDELIAFADVVINLRYPYMGETSASLIRALILGKASIVSDIGWFSELPNEVVIKITIDEDKEVAELRKALELYLGDNRVREEYEIAAKYYSETNLLSDKIASNIISYVLTLATKKSLESMVYNYCDLLSITMNEIGLTSNDDKYILKISMLLNEIYNEKVK